MGGERDDAFFLQSFFMWDCTWYIPEATYMCIDYACQHAVVYMFLCLFPIGGNLKPHLIGSISQPTVNSRTCMH